MIGILVISYSMMHKITKKVTKLFCFAAHFVLLKSSKQEILV